MSLSTAASLSSAGPSRSDGSSSTPTATASNIGSTFSTSKIIRVTVAAGIIVLGLTAIVLFFKISSWIRYFRRRKRQRTIAKKLSDEDQAADFEAAAWSDAPGSAHLWPSAALTTAANQRVNGKESRRRRRHRERERDKRAVRRAGGNAYAVHEWEGVAQ